jgi:hypothetical protein
VERRGAALHLEPAGQDSVGRHAAVDAALHGVDDRGQAAVDLLVGQPGALIVAGYVGDRHPLALGDGEQLVGAVIVPGHVPGALRRGVAGDRRLVDHRAAADRIGDPALQCRPAGVEGGEAHAVRVVGQALALEEFEVALLVERDLARAAEADPAGLADPGDDPVRFVGIDRVGTLPGQAEQDGAVGGVSLAGQSQRAVEIDPDPFGRVEHPLA